MAAETTAFVRDRPVAGRLTAALRATLRPLLIAHIIALLAGYVLFFAVWAVSQFEVVLGLFGVRRWRPSVSRWSPRGVAAGLALWLIGTVLGAVWARCALGRYWAWDPVEVQSLAVTAVSGAWAALAWRGRESASLVAAGSALLFWVLLDLHDRLETTAQRHGSQLDHIQGAMVAIVNLLGKVYDSLDAHDTLRAERTR